MKETEQRASPKRDVSKNTKLNSPDINIKSANKETDNVNEKALFISDVEVDNEGIFEQCSGCLAPIGSIYCITCEKTFCSQCENTVHLLPAYKKHERVPLKQMIHIRKVCVNHKIPLKYYCESCNDPICSECFEKGSHSNKLHKISNILDSFKKKYQFLNNIVTQNLLTKKDKLLDQMQLIESVAEQVKMNKNEIERQIKKEYINLLETLKNEEGKKLSILLYESSILQKEVNKINDIASYFRELNVGIPDMITFLLKFSKLNESIENCLAKPVKVNIEVKVNDYPNEIEERNFKLQKYEKMKGLVRLKDEIIWNLILDKKERSCQEEVIKNEKHINEINELNKVINKLMNESNKNELVCHFCGVKLDDGTVNTGCHRNIPESSGRSFGVMREFYTTSQIPIEFAGNKRHFFGHSSKHPVNSEHNGLFNSFPQFSQTFTGKNESLKKSHGEISNFEEGNVLDKMKNDAASKKTTIFAIFQKAYKESDVISSENFIAFLKKNFSLTEKESDKFLSNFKLHSPNIKTSSTASDSNSYHLSDVFDFLRHKQLHTNYNDGKIDYFPNSDVISAGRISEWIYQVASIIEKNGINLFSKLSSDDKNEDGFISTDDLRITFIKLKLNLNTNDIESMMSYFGLQNNEKIDICEFTKNFMAHIDINVNNFNV